MTPERLDEELSFDDDGHLSELAFVFLADGQEALLVPRVSEHLNGCVPCTERLGVVARLAFSLEAALLDSGARAPAASPALLPARPFPLAGFALGLALTVLGVLPGWLRGGGVEARLWDLAHDGLAWLHRLRFFVPLVREREGAFVLGALLASAAFCVGAGWMLARTAPLRREGLA